MFSLAILGILFGAILGLRFKVLVLVPAITIGALLIVGGGLALGVELWQATIGSVVTAITLQIGFLGSSAVRYVVPAMRFGSERQSGVAASRLAH